MEARPAAPKPKQEDESLRATGANTLPLAGQESVCLECGSTVSYKLFNHYEAEHVYTLEQYKAAMREVNCNFLGQSIGPGQPKRQQTKLRREHAELKKREDDGRRS